MPVKTSVRKKMAACAALASLTAAAAALSGPAVTAGAAPPTSAPVPTAVTSVANDVTIPASALSKKAAKKGKTQPTGIRMTWFGITNWHYQIGDVGIMLDGAVGDDNAVVGKARKALEKKGTIDYLLIGHNHGDHTEDTLKWAQQTGAPVIGPASACAGLVADGLAASQCRSVKGGETIKVSKYVEMRVVHFVHSVDCGETSPANGGTETLGYLFTVKTKKKLLTLYTTDSGAGNAELVKEHIVDGENRGAPLSNLGKAMRDADIRSFDVWQAGPESRPASQAKYIVPTIQPKYFMPHHIAARGGFDLLGGMHYAYDTAEFPKLMKVLDDWDIPNVYPTNYFDAWVYDAKSLRPVGNKAVKAVVGLPASGPGPKPQGPNPRAGQLECAED